MLLASGKARESIPEFEAALHLNPELKAAADALRQAQAQLSSQDSGAKRSVPWPATVAPRRSPARDYGGRAPNAESAAKIA